MIKQYPQGSFISISKPHTIAESYIEANGDGFTVDYLYGPYDTPDDSPLNFSYDDDDGNTVNRPNYEYDAPEAYEESNGQLVYRTKLYYQKALAEQILRDTNQFFVGRKVAFINDDGDKAVEYAVVSKDNILCFEETDSNPLEIYTINFRSLQTDGAQAPITVASRYFTMPRSSFVTPQKMLFEGWQFGYENADNEIVFDVDDNEEDIMYDYGHIADLHEICDRLHIGNNTLTCFACYASADGVVVEFESGVYNNGVWSSLNGSEDFSGYIKVQSGDDAATNTQPDDWAELHSAYFTISDNDQAGYYSYTEVSAKILWRKYENLILHDQSTNVNPIWSAEWTKENFISWFGSNEGWKSNPEEAFGMSLGSDCPPYVYITSINESTIPVNNKKELVLSRTWYVLDRSSGTNRIYTPCKSSYELYKNQDLYTLKVRNGFSMFNNGELIGNVHYDCVGSVIRAYQNATLQFNSDIIEPYNDRFQFDHWEVIPQQRTYNTTDLTYSNIQDASYELPYENSVTTLNSCYTHYTLSNEMGNNVTEETIVPADRYVFRAVYRKRLDKYTKLTVTTNYTAQGPQGNVEVYCTYKNFRNETKTKQVAEFSGNDQKGIVTVPFDLSGEYFFYDDDEKSFYIYPKVVSEVQLYTNPQNIENTQGSSSNPDISIGYCWTDESNEIVQYVNIDSTKPYNTNPLIIDIKNGEKEYKYKAWFVYQNDTTGVLTVGRRKETPTGNASLATTYNGSNVGIYDYIKTNYSTGETNEGSMFDEVSAEHVNPGMEYTWYVPDYETVTASSGNTRAQQDTGHAESILENNHQQQVSYPSNAQTAQNSLANLDFTAVPYNQQWDKIIDLNNQYSSPLVGVPLGREYFIYATEGQNDGAKFLRWSDGVTTNPRLVKVALPLTYKYVAVFEGAPMTANTSDSAQLFHSDLSYYDLTVVNNNGSNIADINNLSDTLNMIEVDRDDITVGYVNNSDIGVSHTPSASKDYTAIQQLGEANNDNGEPVGSPTITYDYNGTQFKSENIKNGVTVEIE